MKEPFKCCWNCRLGGIRLHPEINFGHEISEAEAKKLNTMTVAERLKYWWNTLNA